jgi:hypothetical protein
MPGFPPFIASFRHFPLRFLLCFDIVYRYRLNCGIATTLWQSDETGCPLVIFLADKHVVGIGYLLSLPVPGMAYVTGENTVDVIDVACPQVYKQLWP